MGTGLWRPDTGRGKKARGRGCSRWTVTEGFPEEVSPGSWLGRALEVSGPGGEAAHAKAQRRGRKEPPTAEPVTAPCPRPSSPEAQLLAPGPGAPPAARVLMSLLMAGSLFALPWAGRFRGAEETSWHPTPHPPTRLSQASAQMGFVDRLSDDDVSASRARTHSGEVGGVCAGRVCWGLEVARDPPAPGSGLDPQRAPNTTG